MQKVTKVLKENATNIAFIGRPNVGKSSLFNRLLGTYALIFVRATGLSYSFLCFYPSAVLVVFHPSSSHSLPSHSPSHFTHKHTHTPPPHLHPSLTMPLHPLILSSSSSLMPCCSSSGTDRSIVSDVAGTTRDTVDALVVRYAPTLTLILLSMSNAPAPLTPLFIVLSLYFSRTQSLFSNCDS